MRAPRIYVASSWRNAFQPTVVARLRGCGFEVYDFKNPDGGTGFSWSEIDPNWESWTPEQYVAALSHPIAKRGFRSDMGALAESDACLLVLPCGRSAHLELGYAVGAGKFTVVLIDGKNEPELMAAMCNEIACSLSAAIVALERHFGLGR